MADLHNKAKRTKATKKDYFDRAKLLQIKAHSEYSNDQFKEHKGLIAGRVMKIRHRGNIVYGMHILDTAIWAQNLWAKNLSRRAWRFYRSSINYSAELMYEKQIIKASEVLEIKNVLARHNGGVKKPTRTSASKKKNLVDDDFKVLMNAVKASKSAYSPILRTWLYVNRMVGLRPCEWKDTTIEPHRGELCIVVNNAKNTNGRAHGRQRFISISHLSDKEIDIIKRFSSYCSNKQHEGLFDKMYTNCRILLHNINHRIWKRRKRHITLYSSRHQFSADLKKSGKNLTEIAYLMGHASTDTATAHYGKKRFGRSKVSPHVHPEDTTGVKDTFKKFSFKNMTPAETLDID